MSGVAFRPFLPADAPRCIEIFRSAIEELASEDYNEEQREAWAARSDDAEAFAARLAGALTLLAVVDVETAGFVSLKGKDVLDMLYVDPEHARQGVGAAMIDAVTKLAQARGAEKLTSEVSDVAQSLFKKLGFVAERRSLVTLDDQWLAVTMMTKPLAKTPSPPSSAARH